MIKRIIAACTAAVLALGMVGLTATAAGATDSPPPDEICIPSEGSDAYDETVVDTPAYDETVVDAEAHWQRYSYQGLWDFEYVPLFFNENWQANVEGDPHGIGIAGAYFVSHGSSGNVDWFYLEWVPEVSHIVHHDEVSHLVHHDAIPPVTCEEPEPEPIVCQAFGDWYTESDDAAPVETVDGLVFTGGSGDAVGIRHIVTGNLQGFSEITYNASGDLGVFYPRIVINSLADGGYAYDSLTVVSEGPVNGDSIASSNKRGFIEHTLDEWAALLPNNAITSFGWHLDSGATADQSVILESFEGNCLAEEYGLPPEPEVVPVPALFSAEPTPPTCEVDGSFDFTGEFPNVTITVTPEYTGPGTYTITADAAEGYEFPDGTTHKWVEIDVLGQIATQSENPDAPCYLAPEEPEEPVTPVPPVTPEALALTGANPTTSLGVGVAAMLLGLIVAAGVALRRRAHN